MQLSTSEISELIKSRLDNFEVSNEARTQGTVISVTDGIVRIHGLSNVIYQCLCSYLKLCYC